MAIARTMNRFTCFRDLQELNGLIDARHDLMNAIENARSYRAEYRFVERSKVGILPASICEFYKRNFKAAMDDVRRKFEEYRFRCLCAQMNIVTATVFRDKLLEYIQNL